MRSFDDDIEEIKRTRRSFFGPNVLELCQAADIVFMGLHGSNGEDGKVQATFDLLGIRYTGTGYLSSALAMDKGLTKKIFLMDQVPTPKGVSMLKENCTRNIQDSWHGISCCCKNMLRWFQCRCLYCKQPERI